MPLLKPFINNNKIKAEALDWTNEMTFADSISSSPLLPDLIRKRNIRSILTRSGKPIIGFTNFEDWAEGTDGLTTPLVSSLLLFVFCILTTFLGGSQSQNFDMNTIQRNLMLEIIPFFGIIFLNYLVTRKWFLFTIASLITIGLSSTSSLSFFSFLFPVAFFVMYNRKITSSKIKRLLMNSKGVTITLEETIGRVNEKLMVFYRNVIKDFATSPFIDMAETTGLINKEGDFNAPVKGKRFGTTLNNLFKHLLIYGGTGTGKTWFIRYLLKQIFDAYKKMGKTIGALILDGKGNLADEMDGMININIKPCEQDENGNRIPGTGIMNLNPKLGMKHDEFALSLKQANDGDKASGDHKIWPDEAEKLHVYTGITQEILLSMNVQGIKNNLTTHRNLMPKMFERKKTTNTAGEEVYTNVIADILKQSERFKKSESFAVDTVNYILSNMHEDRQKIGQSVLATAESWIGQFFINPLIRPWCDCETSDFNIEDITTKGLIVGASLDRNKHGTPGWILQVILKNRFRGLINARPTDWRERNMGNDAILVQDEFHFIATDLDAQSITTDRDRGLINIAGTQNRTNFLVKFSNKDLASQMESGFTNIISRWTGDKETNETLIEKAQTISNIKSTINSSNPVDFRFTNQTRLMNIQFNPNHYEADEIKKFRTNMTVIYPEKDGSDPKTVGDAMLKKQSREGTIGNFRGRENTMMAATYSLDEKESEKRTLSPKLLKELEAPQIAFARLTIGNGSFIQDIVKLEGLGKKTKHIDQNK